MAGRSTGGSSYMHSGYQMPGRYVPGHQGMMAMRHGTSSLAARMPGGVQHGRVSDLAKKRLAEARMKAAQQAQKVKKRKLGDRVLSQRVRDLVPESQAYMDLLAFERKLDSTIMRKKLEIQEALRRPMKQKRKLRVFVSHQFTTPESGKEGKGVPQWQLKIEGRLLDESGTKVDDKSKLRFTNFFKNLVVELDREVYGPDSHLAEWHRSNDQEEMDGFTVTRPGEGTVKCTVLLTINHQVGKLNIESLASLSGHFKLLTFEGLGVAEGQPPVQYKLTSKLARLLGLHTAKRPDIINAVWQYINTNRLQDPQEREYINCDKYFQQIFEVPRMKFTEIPRRLQPLLAPPDPIVIHHLVNADAPEGKRTACYDVELEIDDPLKASMHSFLMSGQNMQEIGLLDNKIHETVEQINAIKLQREFYLGFSDNPQKFINDWLASQNRDLKVMKDQMGNTEAERKSSYFERPWCQEAIPRYFYAKVSQRKSELEQALGIRHP